MSITLFETFRAVFYAPYYAAHALGAYDAEGIEVNLHTPSGPEQTALGLMSGAADVSWGGPMRILHTYHTDPDCDLVAFCEVVTRDPFLLVGRRPIPDFSLGALRGLRLATVSEVPTPWLCLQQDLRDAGLDPAALQRNDRRTMAENAAALRNGDADVVQLFEPYVTELVDSGAGHILYAAATRGPTSYTTFYTRRGTLRQRADTLYAMTRAIYRTLKWVHGHDAATLAETIRPFFEAVPHATLTAALQRYRTLGIWGRNPRLPRAGFERLKASCVSGGLIDARIPYETCVDTAFADRVIQEDSSGL